MKKLLLFVLLIQYLGINAQEYMGMPTDSVKNYIERNVLRYNSEVYRNYHAKVINFNSYDRNQVITIEYPKAYINSLSKRVLKIVKYIIIESKLADVTEIYPYTDLEKTKLISKEKHQYYTLKYPSFSKEKAPLVYKDLNGHSTILAKYNKFRIHLYYESILKKRNSIIEKKNKKIVYDKKVSRIQAEEHLLKDYSLEEYKETLNRMKKHFDEYILSNDNKLVNNVKIKNSDSRFVRVKNSYKVNNLSYNMFEYVSGNDYLCDAFKHFKFNLKKIPIEDVYINPQIKINKLNIEYNYGYTKVKIKNGLIKFIKFEPPIEVKNLIQKDFSINNKSKGIYFVHYIASSFNSQKLELKKIEYKKPNKKWLTTSALLFLIFL